MERYKTWIIRAVKGIVFVLVLAAMVLRLDSALKLIQEDNLCPRYYKYDKNTFDVTFLGASLVMYGIYPMELYSEYGIASYSLTTGNQSLEASYYLAKESIEKDHPSLIVLDCSFASSADKKMDSQYVHYITDTMPYLSKTRLDIIRNLSKEEDLNPLLFPLIAFHSRWQELTYEDAAGQTKEMVYGAKVTGRVNESVPYKEGKITPGAMSEESRDSIEKIIRLCRENDTELLLITMPIIGKNKFFDQDGYNLRASAAAEVSALAEKNGILHANYLGREEELGFDLASDAYDGEHLNRWGAARFTKQLGRFIKENYEIPDRRGEGGKYAAIEEDAQKYPLNRMRDSLQRSIFLRDYSATLKADVLDEPVEDVLVLVTLNGKVDGDILTKEDAALLQAFGLRTDLHAWEGHGWLAVIDDGKVVYETSPDGPYPGNDAENAKETAEDAGDHAAQTAEEDADAADFMDSYAGTAGKLQYEVVSGRVDGETGKVHSDASIRVNRLEYAAGDRGLHFAVFQKSTGKLLDAGWLDIHSRALQLTHDNH